MKNTATSLMGLDDMDGFLFMLASRLVNGFLYSDDTPAQEKRHLPLGEFILSGWTGYWNHSSPFQISLKGWRNALRKRRKLMLPVKVCDERCQGQVGHGA